jgi:hypothetical protein
MKRTFIFSVAIGLMLTAQPSHATKSACTKPQLTNERILEIVKTESKKRGRVFDPKQWEYKVTRRDCIYVFFASQVPAVPGGHFWYEINEDGKVIEVIPGA